MEKCGAPADLIQVLTEVTIENSQALMEACDLIIATGGSAHGEGRLLLRHPRLRRWPRQPAPWFWTAATI